MTDNSPDIVRSIYDQLSALAKKQGQNFESILYRYANERFLYRLACSQFRENFVLKGGQVFAAWGAPLGRPTRDIDFRGYLTNDPDRFSQIVQEICSLPVEPDGLFFDLSTIKVEDIHEEDDYHGLRVKFLCLLGRARINMQLDIGFMDNIEPAAQYLAFPVLLDGPQPCLLSYPKEAVVAEKFQAMVQLDMLNSRLKDFYDIWFLSQKFEFNGVTLQQAIVTTFLRRETDLPVAEPVAFTQSFITTKQASWQAFCRRQINQPDTVPLDLSQIIATLREFLLPLVEATVREEKWAREWSANNGWQ